MNYIKNNEKAISWIQGNLDEERLLHSLGTAQCAAELAAKFGEDQKRAYIAGLLHDCAKCLDDEKLLEIARNLPLKEGEIDNDKVIHAPVSAYLASSEFNIKDEEVLSAIRWHTLGRLNMSLFEKIIFLADKIEPNTKDLDFRDKILLFLDKDNGLNKALLICYKETIKSLVTRNLKICKDTIDIYNSML